MSRLRYNRVVAADHLRDRCAPLSEFINVCGPYRLQVESTNDVFSALARAIVYQQLSGKAAQTIHGRFAALFPRQQPAASRVLNLDIPKLRSVGLSQNKALAIMDLAKRDVDGSLASRRRLASMSDEDVIENLCQVRGIGPWTAQMFLMFNLGRPDVMAATDLGVQKGVKYVYQLESLPSPDQVLEETAHLAPYRSAACWYFWQAADTVLMT